MGASYGSTWSDPISSWTTRRTAVSCAIECPAPSFCLAWSQYNATVYLGTVCLAGGAAAVSHHRARGSAPVFVLAGDQHGGQVLGGRTQSAG